MKELSITISGPEGTTMACVDGVQISLIQEIVIRSTFEPPYAETEVRFPSAETVALMSYPIREKHVLDLDLLREVVGVKVTRTAADRPSEEAVVR